MSELPPKTRAWTVEPLSAEVKQSVERLARLEDVARVALMPDVHLAENVCVGAVVATRGQLLPDAVGGDIGCGMAAVQLDRHRGVIDRHAAGRILAAFNQAIPATRHRQRRPLPEALATRTMSHPSLQKVLTQQGSIQLGSLGSGNHFLELLAEESGSLWLMVHSGSRAVGPAVRQHHQKAAVPVGNGLRALPAESDEGCSYLADHDVALAYADANRRSIVAQALDVLGSELGASANAETFVTCTHNFVRREVCGGETLWIHRKGAISARDGEPGLIPGSMGTESFIVEGRGEADSLFSSSHGAGRAMSRGMASRRLTVAGLEREMQDVWFDERLARRLLDEAPSAYKSIASVMRAQKELTRIVQRLRPVLSYKGA